MADDPRLGELLLEWQEQYENGRDVPAAELCSDCPELAGDLARQIAVLRHVDGLARETPAESLGVEGATGSYTPSDSTDPSGAMGAAARESAFGISDLVA
jgi:hypothetical protein